MIHPVIAFLDPRILAARMAQVIPFSLAYSPLLNSFFIIRGLEETLHIDGRCVNAVGIDCEPSTPALLLMMVRFLIPLSRVAIIRSSKKTA